MPTTKEAVFERDEFWRLWTTLFAHVDFAHLARNLLLLLSFAFFLIGFFGPLFLPSIGLAFGGITYALVLRSLPDTITLVGISGVVY